jgi:hypothetical protein
MIAALLLVTSWGPIPAAEPLGTLFFSKGQVTLQRSGKPAQTIGPIGGSSDQYRWQSLFPGDRVTCGASGQAKVFDARKPPSGVVVAVHQLPGKSLRMVGDASVLPPAARRKLQAIGKVFGAPMGSGVAWLLPLADSAVHREALVLRMTSELASQVDRVTVESEDGRRHAAAISYSERGLCAGKSGYVVQLPAGFPTGSATIRLHAGPKVLDERAIRLVAGSSLLRTEMQLRQELADPIARLGQADEEGRHSEYAELLIRLARLEPENETFRELLRGLFEERGLHFDRHVAPLLRKG